MKVEIKGNPGTGNTYIENNIEHIDNNFPAVKEVTIIKDASGKTVVKTSGASAPDAVASETAAAQNTEPVNNTKALKESKRADIIKYVASTLPLVQYQWKPKYMDLWNDILNIPEVDAVIYNKGHQQKTSFNRREVLHIICFLGKHAAGGIGIFENSYVAKHVAQQLNDGCESSTRPELGYNTTRPIQEAIDKLMNSKKYAIKFVD